VAKISIVLPLWINPERHVCDFDTQTQQYLGLSLKAQPLSALSNVIRKNCSPPELPVQQRQRLDLRLRSESSAGKRARCRQSV